MDLGGQEKLYVNRHLWWNIIKAGLVYFVFWWWLEELLTGRSTPRLVFFMLQLPLVISAACVFSFVFVSEADVVSRTQEGNYTSTTYKKPRFPNKGKLLYTRDIDMYDIHW